MSLENGKPNILVTVKREMNKAENQRFQDDQRKAIYAIANHLKTIPGVTEVQINDRRHYLDVEFMFLGETRAVKVRFSSTPVEKFFKQASNEMYFRPSKNSDLKDFKWSIDNTIRGWETGQRSEEKFEDLLSSMVDDGEILNYFKASDIDPELDKAGVDFVVISKDNKMHYVQVKSSREGLKKTKWLYAHEKPIIQIAFSREYGKARTKGRLLWKLVHGDNDVENEYDEDDNS